MVRRRRKGNKVMSSKFTFDTRVFTKSFLTLTLLKYPKATERGIQVALKQLKEDADDIPPKTPHKEGVLKGSAVIKSKIKAKAIEGTLTYEMPYAPYQHAGMRFDGSRKVLNYSEAGSGAGFLSKKLVRYYNKYIGLIVKSVRLIKTGVVK